MRWLSKIIPAEALNTISAGTWWIRGALGLQSDYVPQRIVRDPVIPVLDVLGGGWGAATWEQERVDLTSADFSTDVELASLGTQFLIVACGITVSGGALPVTVKLQLLRDSVSVDVDVFAVSVQPGGEASTQDTLPSGPAVIPWGWGFRVASPAAPEALQTVNVDIIYARLPAGIRSR